MAEPSPEQTATPPHRWTSSFGIRAYVGVAPPRPPRTRRERPGDMGGRAPCRGPGW